MFVPNISVFAAPERKPVPLIVSDWVVTSKLVEVMTGAGPDGATVTFVSALLSRGYPPLPPVQKQSIE